MASNPAGSVSLFSAGVPVRRSEESLPNNCTAFSFCHRVLECVSLVQNLYCETAFQVRRLGICKSFLLLEIISNRFAVARPEKFVICEYNRRVRATLCQAFLRKFDIWTGLWLPCVFDDGVSVQEVCDRLVLL